MFSRDFVLNLQLDGLRRREKNHVGYDPEENLGINCHGGCLECLEM